MSSFCRTSSNPTPTPKAQFFMGKMKIVLLKHLLKSAHPQHLHHQEALVHYYIRMSNQALKSKVKLLYRTLLHLGKDYPKGPEYFRSRLHAAFMKNKDLKDPKQIELMLAKGNYIVKELEALYMLRKYRTLKKRYYNVES